MELTPGSFGRHVRVLVVGVGRFDTAGLEALASPGPDARALAEALTSASGCAVPASQVTCLVDGEATRATLERELAGISESATAEDLLFFYFAGHGLQRGNDFYLCPADCDPASLSTTAVSGQDLNRLLAQTRARGVLAVLDCCRSAGFAENAPDLFRRLESGDFRILISSARAHQSSWELPDGGSTLFSLHLLEVLQGRKTVGHLAGQVYFSDLLRHLQDGVSEDRERLLPDLPPQEPIFAGAYARDPLLFVIPGLVPKGATISPARYSREHVRRIVVRSAAAIGIALALALGTLYSLLESYQYATTADDALHITIQQGHPRLNAFGFPHPLWKLDIGAAGALPESPLAQGGELTGKLGEPVMGRVMTELRPQTRAEVLLWMGDQAGTRREILAWLGRAGESSREDLLAALFRLSSVAAPEDAELLERYAGSPDLWIRQTALSGLLHVDQERALARLGAMDTVQSLGVHLNLLGELSPPCTPALAGYFRGLANSAQNQVLGRQFLRALVRTGCRVPLPAGLQPKDLAMYGTIAYGADFGRDLAGAILATAADQGRLESTLPFVAEMPAAPCVEGAWRAAGALPESARWAFALALTKHCGHYSLRAAPGEKIEVSLQDRRDRTRSMEIASLDPTGPWRSLQDLFHFASASGSRDVLPALRLIFSKTRDSAVLRTVMDLLRQLGVSSQGSEPYLDSGDDLVRAGAYRWLCHDRPREAVSRLLSELDRNSSFPGISDLLAGVPLLPGELNRVRERYRASPHQRPVIAPILAMRGTREDARRVLSDPDPAVREAAGVYASHRSDLPLLLEELEKTVPFPSMAVGNLRASLDARARFREEITTVPAPARRWYVEMLTLSTSMDRGLAVWLEEQVETLPAEP